MVDLVGHFFVFTVLGIVFLLAPLILGLVLRPFKPNPQKLAAYECGEPTIGSAYVQFDLRFYVVALLFIIFDVEVAFFFPWAAIYGSAKQLAMPQMEAAERAELSQRLLNLPVADGTLVTAEAATKLMTVGFFDLLAFFGILLVGFAYVWKRGDLDWVRALSHQSKKASPLQGSTLNPEPGLLPERELVGTH